MNTMALVPSIYLFFAPATSVEHFFPLDSATGKIIFSEVVHVPAEESLGDIWPLAYEWMVKNSDTEVVQIDNGEVAKLIGRSKMQIFSTEGNLPAGHIHFSITISIKDGRYKYQFSDFVHTGQMLSENTRFPDLGPCEQLLAQLRRVEPWLTRKRYLHISRQVEDAITARAHDLQKAVEAGLIEAKVGW